MKNVANLDVFHYQVKLLSYNIVKRDPIWKKGKISYIFGGF